MYRIYSLCKYTVYDLLLCVKMGHKISKIFSSALSLITNDVESVPSRKRKRNDSFEPEYLGEKELDDILNTPKKMKLLRTQEYIYNKLFVEGEGSDITVEALGESWNLHKVYLSQSPYFNSMFSGSWRESNQSCIKIEIVDPRVNVDALAKVFGSFYLDEVMLEPQNISSVLATATLFQLEDLIERCVDLMKKTINIKTVVEYYEAALEYNLTTLQTETLKWLNVNLLLFVQRDFATLRTISVDLMTKIVSSYDFVVIQSEYSVYSMLRTWIQLQLKPPMENYSLSLSPQSFDVDGVPLLLTEAGKPYTAPFKCLRFQHLVTHHRDMEVVEREKIIPPEWLQSVKERNWISMIYVYTGADKGPKFQDVTYEEFEDNCVRCGRELQAPTEFMWRWTGYNYGMQLVWHFEGNSLKVRRCPASETEASSTLQHRRMLYRASLLAYDKSGNVTNLKIVNRRMIMFHKHEEHTLFTINKPFKFPLILSMKILFTTPPETRDRLQRGDPLPLRSNSPNNSIRSSPVPEQIN